MNYRQIYDKICNKAKLEFKNGIRVKKPLSDPTRVYYEGHHIIPKCMGGFGKPYQWNHPNIVPLTAKEHFLVHLILVKLYPNNPKLIRSLWGMCNQDRYNQRHIVSSSTYAKSRESFVESISGDNHFNKRPENRAKLKWTEERKIKQSIIQKGHKMSEEGIKNIKKSWTAERKINHIKNNPANSDKAIQKRRASMIGSNNWNATKVAQYSIDGCFIKEYGSISEAIKELGRNIGISAVCNGRAKTAGGFIWKKVQ
jgi:hypothetical protein